MLPLGQTVGTIKLFTIRGAYFLLCYITSDIANKAMPSITSAIIKYCARVSFSYRKTRDNNTENVLYDATTGATIMAFCAIAYT